MLALVARRLKLSYNVLNIRNLHCRPTEQCQTFNHNNDESDNSKLVASKHFSGRCEWDLRGRNPNINFNGSDHIKKILSHTLSRGLSDQCWWKSPNSNYNNQAGQLISVILRHFSTTCVRNSLAPNLSSYGKGETKTLVLSRIDGECDWKSSDPYNTENQCILKRYGKQKKRKHCNCEFLDYQWHILKWTTGVIGSFYASKLVCLYARRRRNYREWQLMERALAERQKIQKEVLEKHYGNSKFQRSHVPADKYADNWSNIPASYSYTTIPVTNDHDLKQNKVTIGTQTTDTLDADEPAQYAFPRAVGEFKSIIGHLEFKLGIESMKMNRPEVAISHFRMASVHNHPEATYNLGICHEKGIGTSVNLNSAKEFYRAAANLGHPKSMYNLAVFYAKGIGGLKKNRKAARDLFETASERGSTEAKAALGIRIQKSEDASQILTDKSYQITSELSPAHRAGLSVVV